MIALDCRVIGNETGVDYYTRDLLTGFFNLGVADEILILVSSGYDKSLFNSFKNIKVIPEKKVLVDHLLFASYLSGYAIKAVLHPDNTAFLNGHPHSFVILHDVLPWTHPQAILSQNLLLKLRQKLYLSLQVAALIKVKGIITVSNFSKKEIEAVLKIKETQKNEVQVVSESVSEAFSQKPVLTKKELLEPWPNTENYCFYIGGYEENKNITTLLEAFAASDYKGDLVLGGDLNKYETAAKIKELIEKLSLTERVKLIGTVKEKDLAAWYSYADFFVYPPFFGGFGRPILEALKTGCPVIAANTSSFPEVGGEAAFYFDPQESATLVSKINELNILLKSDLKLEELKKKSKEQAEKFSWSQSAAKIWEIINA